MGTLDFDKVITYEEFTKDLEISNAICYVSGTGSGKSSWVENVLYQHGRVLFVTSRRAKVDQDLKHIDTTYSIFEILNQDSDRHHLITNHVLAEIVRSATSLREDDLPQNYLLDQYIELFDYIVIDEVHSIISDAGFSDDVCIVQFFMDYVAQRGRPIILLTATDKLLAHYFANSLLGEGKKWHVRDITKKCHSTLPAIVMKVTMEYALKEIFPKQLGVHKIVYFVNKYKTIREFYQLFTEGTSKSGKTFLPESGKLLKENQIAVMVSERGKEIIEETVRTLYSELAEVSLKNDQKLPDDIMLLLTTSCLKEGVSIKNDETFIVFCESHNIVDLVQYMGRLRASNYILYIISDAIPHDDKMDEIDYLFAKKEDVNAANRFYFTLDKAADKNIFIQKMEKGNRYIRFNPIRRRFEIYSSRYLIESFQRSRDVEIDKVQGYVWERDLIDFCEENGIRYDPDIRNYSINIGRIIEELTLTYCPKGNYVELYKESLEDAKAYLKAKFGIKHKNPKSINENLIGILKGKARIELVYLGYRIPNGSTLGKKERLYKLVAEKL